LIHRDVKPANLLLDRSGTLKILDLGLARFERDQGEPITKLHDAQLVMGTIDYLAPEQALNAAVDIRADIYSLGMTFYFLLAGQRPFEGGAPREKLLWHQVREPQPIAELRPGVPRGLAAVLEKMIAKDPAHRYRTPAAVVRALEPWAPDSLPPPTEAEMPRRSQAARCGADSTTQTAAKATTPVRRSKVVKSLRAHFRRRRALILATGAVLVGVGGFYLGRRLFAGSRPEEQKIDSLGIPEGTPGGREVSRFLGHTGGIDRVALSPDGRLALSAAYDHTAKLWEVSSARELATFSGHERKVTFAAFAGDGRKAVTASEDGTVRTWDVPGRKPLLSLTGHEGRVWSAAYTPDGQFVFSGGADKTARLWNAANGQVVRTFTGHRGEINCVAVSPDGRMAATASWDKTVRLWDVSKGIELRRLEGHTKQASCVEFSPNGRRLLSGGYDGTVRLWDAITGAPLRTIASIPDQVWFVAFSPDGRRAATCGQHPVVYVWDLESGQVLNAVTGHTNGVTAVRWLPDGRRLLTSSLDRTLRLWSLV
jgi:WD40 repeat protein